MQWVAVVMLESFSPTIARVTIVALDGPDIPSATHRGETWSGGVLGQRYAIEIQNLTSRQILAVPTVDGKSTMDGSPGSMSGGGMILSRGQSVKIDGWRTSMDSVAAFRISAGSSSYAAKTGEPENIGVIGVAIFEEKRTISRDAFRPKSVPAGVTRGGGARGMSAGTSYGEAATSRVTSASFERATSTAAEVHVIRYDTTDNLVEAGILPPAGPNPFPDDVVTGFCKAPE